MPNYQTVRGAEEDDMARHKRRGLKDEGGGSATVMSSITNLLNTIIGAGTLAMPAAMSHMGVMLGVFVIVWSAMCSAFGLYLQSRCARYVERGTSSFFLLSQLTWPGAAIMFDSAIAIKCFGVGVSYIIIIGDLMPGVMLGINSSFENIDYLMDRKFWITAFMLGIIPLSFLKRLDSLKYTSIVALCSIGYLIVLVVYYFAVDAHAPSSEIRVVHWESFPEALKALPVVVFAYTCHQNMFSILNELECTSPSSVFSVIGTSIGSAASVYILVAITGYITFGNSVVGNIIGMYDANIWSTIGKLAIVILVTFSIPLQVHPCRASLNSVISVIRDRFDDTVYRESRSTVRTPTGTRPLLSPSSRSSSDTPRDDHASSNMSEIRFVLITTMLLVMSYITAVKVDNLTKVLAYVGATGSTSISFILPGLFYWKISHPDSIHHQRLAKEDDDMDILNDEDELEDEVIEETQARRRVRRWWKISLDNVDNNILRRMALGLAIYGFLVMIVALSLNIFVGLTAH